MIASIENQETIKKSVSQGLGISVLSALASKDEVEEGHILAFPIRERTAEEILIWCITKTISFPGLRSALSDRERRIPGR